MQWGGGGGGLLGGAGLGVGFGLAQMLVRDQRGGETLTPATPGVTCGSGSTSSCPKNAAKWNREPSIRPATPSSNAGR